MKNIWSRRGKKVVKYNHRIKETFMEGEQVMRKISELFSGIVVAMVFFAGSAFAGEKVFFYHNDPAGSPLAITDQNGNVVWRADYRPFGEVQSITGSIENNRQFIGKEKDKETGLHYILVRYYLDEIGRFISPDPVGPVDPKTSKTNYEMLLNPQKLNRYAYALNNPYKYMDPDGRDAIRVQYIGYMVDTGVKFRGKPIKLPLGHAAVIAVDPTSGETKYYEYGRYGSDFGRARNKPVPNLVMKDGEPTEKSLQNLYKFISKHYGQGKPVDATYYDDADFNKVVDFATDRMNDKNRAPYDKWSNNCKTFSKEAIEAGRKEE
ncbi:MAG: RHS repeat-associated core domain-containing protein [Nitrospirota bacterium]